MKNKTLTILLFLNLIFTALIGLYLYQNNTLEVDFSDDILKVRGLVVVDSLGVERVILGAPLPPPQMHGYRFDRGENSEVSGVMLYDSEGQERSGYVTDNDYGNVFFTLDSKTSQRVLFVAEPQGTATLRMWGKNGNQVEIGSGDEGSWIRARKNGEDFNLLNK
ncbi:hypothetical protein [Robertkochia aurantiaca]|uniref:hypothetical protein n=1 Tax=Robertkochia aurantiaca TaxID=2873700 RepID=UPI001CCEA68F|nr:hypothetical protein [Robertkochia sp. 3YJGBD-33]